MVMTYIAAGLMIIGLVIGVYQLQQLQGKVITMGKVVDLPQSRGRKGQVSYGIEARFHNDLGQEFNYTSSWNSTHPGYRVGDPIKIYYSREQPQQGGLCSFGGRLGIAYFIFGIGLALGGITWGYSYSAKVFDAAYPVNDRLER